MKGYFFTIPPPLQLNTEFSRHPFVQFPRQLDIPIDIMKIKHLQLKTCHLAGMIRTIIRICVFGHISETRMTPPGYMDHGLRVPQNKTNYR